MMTLVILREGPRQGIDIARELERRTNSLLSFPPGTLYPILHQLHKQGQIEFEWERPETGRAWRVYRLTDKGRAEVEHLMEAWNQYTAAVQNVMENGSAKERSWLAFLKGAYHAD